MVSYECCDEIGTQLEKESRLRLAMLPLPLMSA